jgi:hypothetical protein
MLDNCYNGSKFIDELLKKYLQNFVFELCVIYLRAT